jgi:sec-independent protein translocase protein TatA
MRIGMSEILVILLAALILFGPSRLPEMGKALGKAIREFRNATSDLGKELEQVREEISREAPPATAKQATKSASETPVAAETDLDQAAGNGAAKDSDDDAAIDKSADDPEPKPQSASA